MTFESLIQSILVSLSLQPNRSNLVDAANDRCDIVASFGNSLSKMVQIVRSVVQMFSVSDTGQGIL